MSSFYSYEISQDTQRTAEIEETDGQEIKSQIQM